jgi:hypothetical protein
LKLLKNRLRKSNIIMMSRFLMKIRFMKSRFFTKSINKLRSKFNMLRKRL